MLAIKRKGGSSLYCVYCTHKGRSNKVFFRSSIMQLSKLTPPAILKHFFIIAIILLNYFTESADIDKWEFNAHIVLIQRWAVSYAGCLHRML